MSQGRTTPAAKRSALKGQQQSSEFSLPVTSIHRTNADGIQVFYRAAGDPNSPVVLLLRRSRAS